MRKNHKPNQIKNVVQSILLDFEVEVKHRVVGGISLKKTCCND